MAQTFFPDYQVSPVSCANHTYSLLISDKLNDSVLAHLFKQMSVSANQWFIITDQNVANLYLDEIKHFLERSLKVEVYFFTLPNGEKTKSLTFVEQLWNALANVPFNRDGIILALGGGVVGDLAGFVASTYLRGLRWVYMPTTLLAQVDASIGGKTAINLSQGKNLVGSFYSPHAVICHLNSLLTLSDEEYLNALAEVVKCALIADKNFLDWIEKNQTGILSRSLPTLFYLVKRCTQIKIELVEKDEHDHLDIRIALNFGHTLAHAIECNLGYEGIKHGQAVSIGMVVALTLSHTLLNFPLEEVNRVKQLLKQFSLPVRLPSTLTVNQLVKSIQFDKKNQFKSTRFILLEDISKPIVYQNLSHVILKAVLHDINASQEGG